MSFDHANWNHLRLIADHVNGLSQRKLAQLNGFASGRGLMRTHRVLEWVVKGIAWVRGYTIEQVWVAIYLSKAEMNDAARISLVRHMLYGRDASDIRSAGGFSAAELHQIEMKLLFLGCFMPVPAAVAA